MDELAGKIFGAIEVHRVLDRGCWNPYTKKRFGRNDYERFPPSY